MLKRIGLLSPFRLFALLATLASMNALAPRALRAADFKIGPDVQLDSFALCAGSSSYMAIWRDLSTSPAVWRGCSISQTGVSGTPFDISGPGANPLESPVQIQSLVFDGTNFATTWADNRAGQPGVYARRFSADGTPASAEIFVSPIARSTEIHPQLAFTGIDYMLAWQDTASSSTAGASQVRYARLGFSGGLGPTQAVALATGVSSHKLHAVTAGALGEALVTFQDTGVSPVSTRAIRINSGSALLTAPEGLLLSESGFGQLGFGAPLGAFYINDEFSLLTSFGTRMDSSVFRIRVLSDNRVIRSTTPLGDVPQGSTDLAENDLPRSFYNAASEEFFFVRNIQASANTYHITSKRIRLNGEDRDPNMFVIDDAAQGILNGGVAANIGTQYLVAWMDGRRTPAPNKQVNLYGVFIDGAAEGDEGSGAVKTVARASPTIGIAPLTTSFSSSGSTGTIDSALWEFGDGETKDVTQTSHKYEIAGDFIAILTLFRRGLAHRDFVRIFVDSKTKGGGGGPAQTVTGAPLAPSTGVNSDLFFSSFFATLNFAKTQSDSLRLFGFYNPAQIPFSQTDVPVSVTIGNRTFTFTLDEFGTFASESGAKPFLRYQMNRTTGAFQFTTSLDSLQDVLGPFGATNTSVVKPGQEIDIPVSLTYNDIARTELLTSIYTATANKTGTVNFRLGSDGVPGTGYFRILNTAAKERGKVDNRVHQFSLTGLMGFGGDAPFTIASSGVWRVTLGNYSESIPVERFKLTKTGYTYSAPNGTIGILEFNYFFSNGSFGILWNDLPAEGEAPSGMPLSTSPVTSTDMVLNLELALDGGQSFQAGAYARYFRKKINSKKWQIR